MTLRNHRVIHNLQIMINIEEVHLLKDTCLLISRFIIANLFSEKAFLFVEEGAFLFVSSIRSVPMIHPL